VFDHLILHSTNSTRHTRLRLQTNNDRVPAIATTKPEQGEQNIPGECIYLMCDC
jgi:hypothetical protein